MRLFRVTAGIVFAVASAAAGASESESESLVLDDHAVVAERGGAKLLVADIDAKVRTMPPAMRSEFLLDADRMARLVDSMLLSKQLARDAEAAGLHRDEHFEADLALVRTELLSRLQIEAHMAQWQAPQLEALARERYLADPEAFRPDTEIDLRHILFSTENRSDDEAKAMAEAVMARAVAGEDFVSLAREFSPDGEDRSLLANVNVDRLDTAIAQSLSKLQKPGDLVGPVRSRYGWHVVRLDRSVVPDIPPFEAVRDGLMQSLRKEALSAERSRYLNSYSQQPVELVDEVIRKLPGRYAGTAAAESPAPN